MTAIDLNLDTSQRLELMFDSVDRAAAKLLLVNECGDNLPFLEQADAKSLERFRFAASKLSNGKLPELRRAIEVAKIDWRDLLVAAEFADDVHAREHWRPTPRAS